MQKFKGAIDFAITPTGIGSGTSGVSGPSGPTGPSGPSGPSVTA